MCNRKTSLAVTKFQRFLPTFLASDRGSFGLYFAVLSIPLLAVAGVALDFTRLNSDNKNLQAAADSAVLAAILPYSATLDERQKIVDELLASNFEGLFPKTNLNQTVEFIDRTLILKAQTKIKASILNVVGFSTVGHSVVSAAKTRSNNDACILTLNKTKTKSIDIFGGGAHIQTDCHVQVNSNHSTALYASSGVNSVAKKWCAVGGHGGNSFVPTPKSGCDPIDDPYSNLPVPYTAGCDFHNKKVSSGKATLNPGIYCGGLDLIGGDIQLNPGLYIIKNGQFKIGPAKVTGSDLTFYLYGNNATVDFSGNTEAVLSASKQGDYYGMLFVQHKDAASGKTSTINGNPNTKLTGMSYFPTQMVKMGGASSFGGNTDFFGIVADSLQLHGNGTVELKFDPVAAGFPKMTLPGTRLPYLVK